MIVLDFEFIFFMIGQTGKPATGEPLLNIWRHFHHELMLLQSSRHTLFHLAVVKDEDERNAHDAELGGQHRACFNV